MASNKLNTLYFSTIVRSAPRNGPTSSDMWNDTITEITTDISLLSSEWNNKLIPIIDGLPYGYEDTAVDVYKTGLDARTLWVNKVAPTTDTLFYNSTKSRPYTVYETLGNLYTYIDGQIESITATLAASIEGLTTEEKNRIGSNIFNSSSVSSATSLDGKSERNRLNIVQLATDMYGATYTLANTGAAQLTYSVYQMVDALLELHNGNWADDIALNHIGAVTSLTQEEVGTSHPGNDSYVSSPSDLEDDLDYIRTIIKNLKGTASWTSNLSSLYTSGADSLNDLLSSTYGSGTKSATNPWGYQYDNIDGLVAILDAIKTFLGQGSYTDSTPTYTSTNFINNSDPLETAIGKLDTQVKVSETNISTLSGYAVALKTFTGQDLSSDSTPDYSTTYNIANGDSLETAIGKLDNAVKTVSGLVTGLDHGTLAGLTDDDHTQYALTNGTRHFSGPVTVSGQVTSTTTVSGLNLTATQDITVVNSGYGLVVLSANGTRWRITVDNSGALTTAAV